MHKRSEDTSHENIGHLSISRKKTYFQSQPQQLDKSVCTFVAKLTSAADMCGMKVTYMCNESATKNNVLQHIVIRCMCDNYVHI